MSIYLPSVGGKEPFYWGPQTSHMNFCEEDYHITSYIGEFVNTLSSFFYVYLGVSGIFTIWSRGERGFVSIAPYVAVIVLGICSALFHLTLKYPMQLLDDNSMLFGAAIMLHRLLTHRLTTRYSLLLFIGLNIFVSVIIWAHIVLGESTLHQIVFASMMLTSAYKTHSIIATTVTDRSLKKQMRVVGSVALFLFISGYVLWNIDNLACSHLRSLRRRIGLPWAWLLELHGWWHVLTGLAVSLHTLLAECLCPVGRERPLPLTGRVPGWTLLGYGDTVSATKKD